MDTICYSYTTRKGTLRITINGERPGLWALYLNHQLIRPDYRSVHEAAFYASRSDFGDEELDRLLKSVPVSDDLSGGQLPHELLEQVNKD